MPLKSEEFNLLTVPRPRQYPAPLRSPRPLRRPSLSRALSAPMIMRASSVDFEVPRDSIASGPTLQLPTPARVSSDHIVSALWRCGRWQVFTVLLLVSVFTLQSTWAVLSHVFVAGYVRHECAPIWPNLSTTPAPPANPAGAAPPPPSSPPPTDPNATAGGGRSAFVYVPIADAFHRDNTSCSVRVIFASAVSNTSTTFERPCKQHRFLPGPDDMRSTIVTEWNLVCEREHWAEGTKGLFMAGVLVGGLAFPFAADHYGRKPVHVLCEVAGALAGAGLATVSTFTQYSVLKFICGVLCQGTMLTGVVWAMEFLPGRYRATASMAIPLFWSLDWVLYTFLAYVTREWRTLQLIIALPPLLALLFVPLVPESPIWLVSKNKFYTLKKVITRLADRVNRRPFPIVLITGCQMAAEADISRSQDESDLDPEALDARRREYSLLDIVRTRWLLTWTAILGLNWFFNRASFLGLTFLSTFRSGDKFLTFLLHGLVELPAYIGGLFLIRRFGRRRPLVVHQILGCLFFIAAGCLPALAPASSATTWTVVALQLGAKYCVAFGNAAIVVYAPELYPTTLRLAGLGVTSVIGYSGGLVAPFLRLLHRHHGWLPTTLLGVFGIPCSLLLLLLPETSKRPMADTLEEMATWTKAAHSPCCRWRRKPPRITVEDTDDAHSLTAAAEKEKERKELQEAEEKGTGMEKGPGKGKVAETAL